MVVTPIRNESSRRRRHQKDSLRKHIVVIGAGFSGLSAACFLAQAGYKVTVLEKHPIPGGRARIWEKDGYRFDMGPSWYWMPDIFEEFFRCFGKHVSDYYELVRLDPSYSVFFSLEKSTEVPAGRDAFLSFCERLESGSSGRIAQFLEHARFKYECGMYEYTRKPSVSLAEFFDLRLISKSFSIQLFQSLRGHVARYVTHPHLKSLLEFPVLFLGAAPEKTPAMYSLMAYADIVLGTWYPRGGMFKIVEALHSLALSLGVEFEFSTIVEKFTLKQGLVHEIIASSGVYRADAVVCGADYYYAEKTFLPPEYRSYSEAYWKSRMMAPSCLLYYLGLSKRVSGIRHHTLFFDEDLDIHTDNIYGWPLWPKKPLFYVCAPSVTDPSVAPQEAENLFVLVPVSTLLEDSDEVRNHYRNYTLEKMERAFKCSLRDHIVVERSYARADFLSDYGALRGNAYGLANTLSQTALLKPSLHSQRVKNLFYTGQLTVPGPGVPPSLISGRVVAAYLQRCIGL
jgi:phytoene desaturase